MGSWGKTDTLADAPKWLDANDPNASNDLDYAFMVDVDEARVDSNRDKGLKTPGWNLYKEYTDQNGNTRRMVEPLVVMKVTPEVAGDVGVNVITASNIVAGETYTIVSAGNTDFTEIGAANNDVGVTFTANNTTTGSGTVTQEDDTVADS